MPNLVTILNGNPQLISEFDATLPDPDRLAPNPGDSPGVSRPGVARFAGSSISLVHVGLAAADLRCPAMSAARRIDPAAPLPGGAARLIELSPLPFALAPVLRHLPGLPTFYVASVTTDSISEDELFHGGQVLATDGEALVGALFTDGVPIAPWSWMRLIADALDADSDPDAAGWHELVEELYGGRSHCRVLDHAGRPLPAGASFEVQVRRDDDGGVEAARTVALGNDADLEAALSASPGTPSSLFGPPAGRHVALLWSGDPPPGDSSLPVQAIYETGESSRPDGQDARLRLPDDSRRRLTLQVLELANWFPPPTPRTNLTRFHADSRVEPLVDGIETLSRLAADLRAATGAGNGAQLEGWTFNEFALDPATSDATIVDLLGDIVRSDGTVRLLATTFINLNDPDMAASRQAAALLLVVLVDAAFLIVLLVTLGELQTDNWVIFTWLAIPAVLITIAALVASATDFQNFLEDLTDTATGVVAGVNALVAAQEPRIALLSVNPMRLADNPLTEGVDSPLFGLEDDIDRFGVWHNKVQLVKRPPENGIEHVGYLGGVDINRNRMDNPTHSVGGPYHDVHARVTGAVAADLFASFADRWAHDRTAADPPGAEELLDGPDPTQPSQGDGAHLSRIGRTIYRPRPGVLTPPLDFAPDGDDSTYRTLIAAIRSARQYIYIEEQYFTPDDRFIDELLDAASHCRRLLIVLPGEGDQPLGDNRRRALLARLRGDGTAGWGLRMAVGFPQRRPILKAAGRVASRGRGFLARDCLPGDDEVVVASPARVVDPPFWLWVDGELMLARSVTKPVQEPDPPNEKPQPAARVEVLRGTAPGDARWGAHPRHHFKGAPVTMAGVTSVYVHAKTMMIDDTFVSIGSANLNRRGFFSDGEINVFAIPQQLAAAEDNPARALRTKLWAEQLGLPQGMGSSLLRDPVAGFDLFLRSHFAGNRFTPLEASDAKSFFTVTDEQLFPLTLIGAFGLMMSAGPFSLTGFFDELWNYVIDPPSFSDPDPTTGPIPT